MNEAMTFVVAWTAGMALGMMFFGGLWWTIHKGISSRHPALWFFCSMVLRTGTTLAGYYFVTLGQWQQMLLCLLGFTMARFWVKRITRTMETPNYQPKEPNYAPDSR